MAVGHARLPVALGQLAGGGDAPLVSFGLVDRLALLLVVLVEPLLLQGLQRQRVERGQVRVGRDAGGQLVEDQVPQGRVVSGSGAGRRGR